MRSSRSLSPFCSSHRILHTNCTIAPLSPSFIPSTTRGLSNTRRQCFTSTASSQGPCVLYSSHRALATNGDADCQFGGSQESISTAQALHTTLLYLVHAVGTVSASADAISTRKELKNSPSSSRSSLPPNRLQRRVNPQSLCRVSDSAGANTGNKRQLLERLLLHHRLNRAAQRTESSSLCAPSGGNVASDFQCSTQHDASVDKAEVNDTPPPDSFSYRNTHRQIPPFCSAGWSRAFELFSAAVQQYHVPPTTQHFNLLLYIACQHQLWSRVEATEVFHAQLLSSLQQLSTAKVTQLDNRADATNAVIRERRLALEQEIRALQHMEAALLPNAQTYDILLSAALARKSWKQALEYAELQKSHGTGISTDESIQKVLEAYRLAGATTPLPSSASKEKEEEWPASTVSPHQRRSLLTNQRGPQLTAAAQPLTVSSPTPQVELPSLVWTVALRFFRSHVHQVQRVQTLWCLVDLLLQAAAPQSILQVYHDCRPLLSSTLKAVSTNCSTDQEKTALLSTLGAVSDAARETADWRVALGLWSDLTELRRQLLYAASFFPPHRWGTPASKTSLCPVSQCIPHRSTAVADEALMAQQVLENALHALRRVRRYREILDVFNSSFPTTAPSNSNAAEERHIHHTMWTPRALSYVCQSALALQDLSLLLELCRVENEGRAGCRHSRLLPPPPADAFDAALRLVQFRIVEAQVQHRTGDDPARSECPGMSPPRVDHWSRLSRLIYAAYRRNALQALQPTPSSEVSSSVPLTPIHQHLVELLSAGYADSPDSKTAPRRWQQALTHLMSIRHPDAIFVALLMDTLQCEAKMTRQLYGNSSGTGAAEAVETAIAHLLADYRANIGSLPLEGFRTTALSPVGPPQSSPPTTALLLSLTFITSVSVEMAVAAMTSQPLRLLTMIPMAEKLGWLTAPTASTLLAQAQQALIHQTTAQLHFEEGEVQHSTTTMMISVAPSPRLSTEVGVAVGNLVKLYEWYFSSTVSSKSMDARSTAIRGLVEAAAQALEVLQRDVRRQPATAAMTRLIQSLRDAWSPFCEAAVPSSGHHDEALLPPSSSALQLRRRRAELEVATLTVITAALQQISASTLHRCTLWSHCGILLRFVVSPCSVHRTSTMAATANLALLRTLRTFLRLCDRAEAPFVELVVQQWILGNPSHHESLSSSPPNGAVMGMINGLKIDTALADAVPPSGEQNPSAVHKEVMMLALDALNWACRHRQKDMVRRMYQSLYLWLDEVLNTEMSAVTSSPHLCIQDSAVATQVTMLQCLSSGPRAEVLSDWPTLHHLLNHLMLFGISQLSKLRGEEAHPGFHTHQWSSLHWRRAVTLVDNMAAVLVKLQHTWHYLLIQLSLDAHRADAQAWRPHPTQQQKGCAERLTSSYVQALETTVQQYVDWCCNKFIADYVEQCLQVTVTTPPFGFVAHDGKGDSLRHRQQCVASAMTKAMEASWDVLFTHFVWCSAFRRKLHLYEMDVSHCTTAAVSLHAQRLGYQLLSMELRYHGSSSTSLARHLRLWCIFCANAISAVEDGAANEGVKSEGKVRENQKDSNGASGLTVAAAVAQLCNDLTILETWCSTQGPHRLVGLEGDHHQGGSLPLAALFLIEVDTMTETMLNRVWDKTRDAPPLTLPPMANGESPMTVFTGVAPHVTPAVLQVLHRAGHRMLYLLLCEDATDVLQSSHLSSLMRRCLAWSGTAETYQSLLRGIEYSVSEVLRQPDAVPTTLRYISRLAEVRRIAATDVGGKCDCEMDEGAHVELLLQYYLNSPSLRRSSPVSERVCADAWLAMAAVAPASNAAADEAVVVPPVLLPLLQAFPHAVSKNLLPLWQCQQLSLHQVSRITAWMLFILWESVSGMEVLPPLRTATSAFSVPLRRSALTWLLRVRGSVGAITASAAASQPPDVEEQSVRAEMQWMKDLLTPKAAKQLLHLLFPRSSTTDGAHRPPVELGLLRALLQIAAPMTKEEEEWILDENNTRMSSMFVVPTSSTTDGKSVAELSGELPDSWKVLWESIDVALQDYPWWCRSTAAQLMKSLCLDSSIVVVPGAFQCVLSWEQCYRAVLKSTAPETTSHVANPRQIQVSWKEGRHRKHNDDDNVRLLCQLLRRCLVKEVAEISEKKARAETGGCGEMTAFLNTLVLLSTRHRVMEQERKQQCPQGRQGQPHQLTILRRFLTEIASDTVATAMISRPADAAHLIHLLLQRHIVPLYTIPLFFASAPGAAETWRSRGDTPVDPEATRALLDLLKCLCLALSRLEKRDGVGKAPTAHPKRLPPGEERSQDGTVALVRQQLHLLYQEASKEIRLTFASLTPVSPTVHRQIGQQWMETGVLLREWRSLLWTGRLLASTAGSQQDWLCVLPAAILYASRRSPSNGLMQQVQPLIQLVVPTPVISDAYTRVLHNWFLSLQASTASSVAADVARLLTLMNSQMPAAVAASNDGQERGSEENAAEITNRIQAMMVAFSNSEPQPLDLQVVKATSPLAKSHELPGKDGVSAASVEEAVQILLRAQSEDFAAFLSLESSRRRTSAQIQGHRGVHVQAAWHCIAKAAQQRVELPDSSNWVRWFLQVRDVPHSIHFIRPAVSEQVMLIGCSSWKEGVVILQHSLSTLHHTGATAVQQYLMQLLFQRVRGEARSRATNSDGVTFCDGLSHYTYAVQGVSCRCDAWRSLQCHVAHGRAALVCCCVELLLSAGPSATKRTADVVAQHTMIEALRSSVEDAVVTRALFELFWQQSYPRVEGAHSFLSLLRSARLCRVEMAALRSMVVYLWHARRTAGRQKMEDDEEWATYVEHPLRVLLQADDDNASSSAVLAVQHLSGPHFFSAEAHLAIWKSWVSVCRAGVVRRSVAILLLNAFQHFQLITEVEELMVTTYYTTEGPSKAVLPPSRSS